MNSRFIGLYAFVYIWLAVFDVGWSAVSDCLVTETQSEINIDGILDEIAWESALTIEMPYEWLPGDNTPAPVKTECLVTFSKTELYIGFRCFDPEPDKIRAHLMNRDTIDTFILDDYVIIMIDPFNDERRAFQFRVNPLGVQADANFSEMEGYEDFSWDAIWDSAGKITGFGYSVEVSIPFNQLRFPRSKGKQTWGFSLARTVPRKVRYRVGSHKMERNRNCVLCQEMKIHGFEGMSAGKNVELDPTLTVNRTDQREDFSGGNMLAGKIKVEPGISGRFGVTPNLMLNAAVNPDFSHVEADVAQLEVNTRFALRYPEKRPFFLEGGDFFLTPLEAVFSRTVFDPLWGVKLTGKLGKAAIGFFSAQDRCNNLLFPSNSGSLSTSVNENVFGGVLRYRRDIGKGSTLGLLYTGRMSDGYYNHVAGIDGFMRISRTKNISFQFLRSRSDYPGEAAGNFGQPEGAFGGSAALINFRHGGRNVLYGFDYEDLSANFRADYGFIPRVDMRRLMGYIRPRIWGEAGKWFNQMSLLLLGESVTDHSGRVTDQMIGISAFYQGPFQTVIEPGYYFQKEFFNGNTYNTNKFQTYFEMRPLEGLKYFIFGKVGDSIDYSHSRPARSLNINPGIECSIDRHWNIRLSHIFERLFLKESYIYAAHLFQAQLMYNFSKRVFIRGILQYTDIKRNIEVYNFSIDPETKLLFSQFLFSYKINPLTVLFIGYSDNYLGSNNLDITRTDRTFFLKIGYALSL